MIIRILILALLLLGGSKVRAQTKFKYVKVTDFEADKIRSFSVLLDDQEDKVVHLLKDHKKNLYAYLYDKDLEFTGKKIFVEKFKPFIEFISGYTNDEGKFTIYSRNDKKWKYINIDFDTQDVTINDFDFKLKSEVVLTSFSENNAHYVLTIKRNSSLISLYKLTSNGKFSKTDYDFSSVDFSGGLRSIGNLYQLINASSDIFETDFIKNDLPLSLRSANEKVKLYQEGSKIYITSDNSRDFTYVLEIGINSNYKDVKTIEKKQMAERSDYEDSNSFIYNGHLYILKTSFKEMNFSVIDLSTQQIIKSFSALEDQKIDFANTPIQSLKVDNVSDIKSTRKFLEMVTNSKPAINVHKQGENLIVTIGASKLDNSKSEALAVATVILSGGTNSLGVSNAIANKIDRYFLDFSKTKSAQFTTVLDSSFNVIKDVIIQKGSFDKIKDYDLSNNLDGLKTLYKIGDAYYYNYVNVDGKQIQVTEFKD